MMSMIRSKQIFVIFNVNSIFDLDKNLPLHRADMLVNLYPRDGKFAARGCYQVIPAAEGKIRKVYIHGKRYYDYSLAYKIKAFKDTFTSFFPFDDEEYNRRKDKAIEEYHSHGAKTEAKLSMKSRDKLIRYIYENLPGLTQDELARIADVSIKTVYRATKKEE